MGNARKHLFWPLRYPNITCSLCTTNFVDPWPHDLLSYPQSYLHALHIKRQNKAVWELHKLLLSSPLSHCKTLMNTGYFNSNPPENIVPNRLLPCICSTPRCQCNARLQPDLLCIQGLPHLHNPPDSIDPSLTIQFIEFTYTNDQYPKDKINAKTIKYQPLLGTIQALGWKVAPLLVISARVRGTTHIPSIKQLQYTYKFSETLIKSTLTNINVIAIQHLTSIILHKRQLENNQPLPDPNS